jgi:hypothetical protein
MGDVIQLELETLALASQRLLAVLGTYDGSEMDHRFLPCLADRFRGIRTELMRRVAWWTPDHDELLSRYKQSDGLVAGEGYGEQTAGKELAVLVGVIDVILQEQSRRRLAQVKLPDRGALAFLHAVNWELEYYTIELADRRNKDWPLLIKAADRYTKAVGGIASVTPLPYGGIVAKVQPAHPGTDDLGEPPEVISVAVYLDTEDSHLQERVLKCVDSLVAVMGYDGPADISVEDGSIFRSSWARIKKALSSKEVRDRLTKVERAIELAGLDRPQAEVDLLATQAVHTLLVTLADIPSACVRVGSILLVKHQAPEGPVILARTLSQLEIRTLERFPEIQRQPDKVFEALAVAISANAIDGGLPESG